MSSTDSEKNYFMQMQRDNTQAFEYFFKTYVDALYAYAMGFCKDSYQAEDVVQETFVRFWMTRKKITSSESIYGYLQRTVRNICINQKVHAQVEDRYRQEMLNCEDEAFNWDDADALEELRRQLLAAIDRLPEKCREIFVQSCIEGLKYQEVAEKLGISINTVKTQVRFAYKKLRTDLNIPEEGLIIMLYIFLKYS